MKELTQTFIGIQGNCWQTAVACLLEIDPEVMPNQHDYDWKIKNSKGENEYGPSYHNALQKFLHKHFQLTYTEYTGPSTLYAFLEIKPPGWHLMTGRTIRSDSLQGARHVVVARYGEVVWDPHPSRAGLLEEKRWAFLVPYPEEWNKGKDPELEVECECPVCKPGFRCRQPGEIVNSKEYLL